MLQSAWGTTAFKESGDEATEEKGVQIAALSLSDKTHTVAALAVCFILHPSQPT